MIFVQFENPVLSQQEGNYSSNNLSGYNFTRGSSDRRLAYLIRRYRQYLRPIVSGQRFWCDALRPVQ